MVRSLFASQGNPGDLPNHLNDLGPRFGSPGPPGPPVSHTDILNGIRVRPGDSLTKKHLVMRSLLAQAFNIIIYWCYTNRKELAGALRFDLLLTTLWTTPRTRRRA